MRGRVCFGVRTSDQSGRGRSCHHLPQSERALIHLTDAAPIDKSVATSSCYPNARSSGTTDASCHGTATAEVFTCV
jgi:hypothetical protein